MEKFVPPVEDESVDDVVGTDERPTHHERAVSISACSIPEVQRLEGDQTKNGEARYVPLPSRLVEYARCGRA